ncbi:dTDP-4-dehydrorhamnose 3,5-epimerase [Chitiniphilus eburneus]|uniref:dTDP-4-dehydrorhamnose 3,5-epimerase n=1 Tax=Chitiniphilus eburneus TaxID=2571148 RepID=A0A4U0Q7R8_9NEIS|nr:dTDP-4-dehydrorhamnose 3,5-epimerase [Chitiniphilus eburneus]TJZ77276.1 dTDP-4-dehydrorhamnose 3,5-epimerase [Chitiniphilus eburneus]
MKIIDTAIPDVKIIEPQVFDDARGFFYESFNQARFEKAIGRNVSFVQDNHSYSLHGVLRGLHYQLSPRSQGKLVRCVIGEVFDVAVDIRKSSPTFGHSVSTMLSANNHRQLWIPEGFAHGFLVLSEAAEFIYKTTEYWDPQLERTILWSSAGIEWPEFSELKLSIKDAGAPPLAQAELPE